MDMKTHFGMQGSIGDNLPRHERSSSQKPQMNGTGSPFGSVAELFGDAI